MPATTPNRIICWKVQSYQTYEKNFIPKKNTSHRIYIFQSTTTLYKTHQRHNKIVDERKKTTTKKKKRILFVSSANQYVLQVYFTYNMLLLTIIYLFLTFFAWNKSIEIIIFSKKFHQLNTQLGIFAWKLIFSFTIYYNRFILGFIIIFICRHIKNEEYNDNILKTIK